MTDQRDGSSGPQDYDNDHDADHRRRPFNLKKIQPKRMYTTYFQSVSDYLSSDYRRRPWTCQMRTSATTQLEEQYHLR